MNFPLYIAKRYLFSKSSANAINIITIIATFGVIVGSLALFTILSIFSGLRTFNSNLLNASDPDIKISPSTGKTFLLTPNLLSTLNSHTDIISYSKIVEERVFLKHGEKNHIANIKGVDTSYTNTVAINPAITIGNWIDPNFKNTAVIGTGIAYKLSLGILNFGEALEIHVPKPGKGFINPNNAFRSEKVQVIGMYSGGNEGFQDKYVFTELPLAQKLLNYKKEQISAIAIKLASPENSVDFKNQLQNTLGTSFKVATRQELNTLFYKVINTENFISYLIFTLIVIIALFNVIGAIIMMIIDKRNNLKTLFNLGTSLQQIKNIFVLQGFLLSLVGMAIGLTVGIILVTVQQKFNLIMITQNIPYPIEFRWSNLFMVICTITILGFVAAKIASSRITQAFIEK